jgi:formate hydrogenlyase subunit 3/multisubunit Na+/H+ antiporter MnhD subunit
METASIGKILIFVGLMLVVIGLLTILGGKLIPFGRLPGDIRVEKDNFSFYFPVVSCLLASAFFSFILWIVSKFK